MTEREQEVKRRNFVAKIRIIAVVRVANLGFLELWTGQWLKISVGPKGTVLSINIIYNIYSIYSDCSRNILNNIV